MTNSQLISYLNVKGWNFSFNTRNKQECPLLSLLFCLILEVLAKAIRNKKYIKGIQIRTWVNFCLQITWFLYRNPWNSTKKIARNNKIQLSFKIKNKDKIQLHFYALITNYLKRIVLKTVKYLRINLTKVMKDLYIWNCTTLM